MNLSISTDIGGTFTVLVCVDENGELNVVEVSTTMHGDNFLITRHELLRK